MKKLETEQQFNDMIAQEKPTIAVFKATWCKDCHFIEPFMPEVEKQYEDQINFIEVDRDQFPDLCDKYNVLGIPSFIAFKENQELVRFVSKLQKTRTEIEQFIDRAVQVASTISK